MPRLEYNYSSDFLDKSIIESHLKFSFFNYQVEAYEGSGSDDMD